MSDLTDFPKLLDDAHLRSEASTAASRALFILACARPMVADMLRWNGGLGPCTMLLTAGPQAETTLWACTLLGLLADGNRDVQDGIVKVSKVPKLNYIFAVALRVGFRDQNLGLGFRV
jgi:hypothetical protein